MSGATTTASPADRNGARSSSRAEESVTSVAPAGSAAQAWNCFMSQLRRVGEHPDVSALSIIISFNRVCAGSAVADAEASVDRVGTEERMVRGEACQRGLRQRTDEPLA